MNDEEEGRFQKQQRARRLLGFKERGMDGETVSPSDWNDMSAEEREAYRRGKDADYNRGSPAD